MVQKQSYLTTHKYIRYLVFAAAILIGFYAISLIVGVDTAIRWAEGVVGSQGVDIITEVKP